MKDNKQYDHTLRYKNMPNTRPLFQTYIENPSYTEDRRYYSSVDVELYFGPLFIDEAAYIQYTLSESAMMLFGYNSYVFDGIAKGSRLIQGQFAVNFTKPNYLIEVLSKLNQMQGGSELVHSKFGPMWGKGFDIYFCYGDGTTENSQLVRLADVYITGVSTEMNAKSGEPLMEVYTFVARDMFYGAEVPTEADSSVPPDEPSTYENLELLKVVYDSNKQNVVFAFDKVVDFKSAKYSIGGTDAYRNILGLKVGDSVSISINPMLYDTFKNQEYVMIKLNVVFELNQKEYTKDYEFNLYVGNREELV